MINSNEDTEATLLYKYYYDLKKQIRNINNEIKILKRDRDYYIKQKLLTKLIIIRYLTDLKIIKKDLKNGLIIQKLIKKGSIF